MTFKTYFKSNMPSFALRKIAIITDISVEETNEGNEFSTEGIFVNGVYRPSTASNLILSQQLKNEYDERMSTNIPKSSDLKSNSPKKKVGQSSFKNIFQKVPVASSSKATALISNSSWTAPIINSSPIPINLFVPKTHNKDFEEENIIHDFDHGESQKVYAPVAHSHNEVHEHEASEKGTREIFVYIYICVIYNSATINIFIKSHFS